MVDDLGDVREVDFDNFAVGAFDLDAGACERLRLLEAAHDAANARARLGDDLDVVLAVERLERREGLSYFQLSDLPFCSPVEHTPCRAAGGACARARREPKYLRAARLRA